MTMTSNDWPLANDLAELIRNYAQPGPAGDTPAFSFYAGAECSHRLTHAELARQVQQTAGALATTYSIRRGDRVAVLMANGPAVPVVMLAVMVLGAIVVPLNPTFDATDWIAVSRDSAAVGLVVSDALKEKAAVLAPELRFIASEAELAAHAAGTAEPMASGLADAPAVILYTSGTTGRPKGVMLSHANLLANGRAMATHFGLDRAAQFAVMPLYHAHALGFGLMTALVSRGHLVLANGMNAFHWASIIRAESVQVTSLVPPLLPFLTKVRVRAAQVPSLKAVLVSSAPLPVQLARDFIDRTGLPLVQGWGLSEFTNFATCADADGGLEQSRQQLTGHQWPTIGRPLPGVEVEVRNAVGEPQPAGVKGELCVRGASRMLGYYAQGRPPVEPGDWLATGDEGYFDVDAQGPLFFITGRIKDIIIRDAEKLSPLAIEHHLLQRCPQLEGRIAVVGFEHALHGEEIGAYVTNDSTEAPLTGEADALGAALLEAARELGNATRPKVILWGHKPVPRTHTGKVQRMRLKELFTPYDTYSGPTRIECAYDESGVPRRAAVR